MRHGELHDAAAVAHGVVEHEHAVVGAGALVDAVVADAAQLDRVEVGASLQHPAGDRHPAALNWTWSPD